MDLLGIEKYFKNVWNVPCSNFQIVGLKIYDNENRSSFLYSYRMYSGNVLKYYHYYSLNFTQNRFFFSSKDLSLLSNL